MKIYCTALVLTLGVVIGAPRIGRAEEQPALDPAASNAPQEARVSADGQPAESRDEAQLQHDIADLNRQVAELMQKYGRQHPAVEQLERQVEPIERALDLLKSNEANAAPLTAELTQQALAYAQKAEEYAKQLAERDQQLKALSGQMKQWEQEQNLPPIEGDVKIFRLAHVPAPDAAKQVLSLFGAQALRVAIDSRTNSLIVFGRPEHVKPVEAILMQLDAGDRDAVASAANREGDLNSRSVLLRVFWLADGLPEGEASDLFLPASVIDAVAQLGLKEPRLVAQTVNAIATRQDDAQFETTVPAIVFGQPSQLYCTGVLKPAPGDRMTLGLKISVSGGAQCDLRGSLVTPMAHYMVLGTANSIANDMGVAPGMERGGMGMSPAGGAGEMAEGGPQEGGGMVPGVRVPKFRASRFAFVVQVVDAESYAPEQ